MTQTNETLHSLEQRLEQAAAELDRYELVERLCQKEGLSYASLTEDRLGPMLVVYHHQPIGEVHTTSPSALKDWHARPYLEDGTLGSSHGPYVNARAAAASLIPNRQQPVTGGAG